MFFGKGGHETDIFKNKAALVSKRAYENYGVQLSKIFGTVIALPAFSHFDKAVEDQPDMLVSVIDKSIVTSRAYFNTAKDELLRIAGVGHLELVLSDVQISGDYPHDIAFNTLVCQSDIFCLEEHTAPEIKALATKNHKHINNVRQGYSACSCVCIGGAVITADELIAVSAEKRGIKVLKISSGGVSLSPYPYGFIGGACGYSDGALFSFGDIGRHPEGKALLEFLHLHGVRNVPLANGELCDFGGIKIIDMV